MPIRRYLDGAGLLALLVGTGLTLSGITHPVIGFVFLFFALTVLLYDVLSINFLFGRISVIVRVAIGLLIFLVVLYISWSPMSDYVTSKQESQSQQAQLSKKDILNTLKEGIAGLFTERLETKVLRKYEQKQEQTQSEPPQPKPNDKSATPNGDMMIVELAPRVVHYVLTYKTSGETGRQNEYGFAVIVRVRNEGKSFQQLKSLEITGDIDAGSSYDAAFGLGKTAEEIDIEYGKTKPYLRLSFVAFPINANKIEAASEEFIRFMILDPTQLGTQAITRGAEAEKYIGFRGKNAAEPKLLQTVPSISFFAKPTGFQHVRPGNAQWTAVTLRDEIKSGRLRFTVQFNSGPQIVVPSKITNVRLIALEDWSKQTSQDIFFDMDHRFIPVEKDPLIQRPRRNAN